MCSARRAPTSAPSTARRVRRCSAIPTEENRVWALFDWDEEGWAKFVSDPEVPPILKEAGHLGKPEAAPLLGSYEA